jgi:hypothetical protein
MTITTTIKMIRIRTVNKRRPTKGRRMLSYDLVGHLSTRVVLELIAGSQIPDPLLVGLPLPSAHPYFDIHLPYQQRLNKDLRPQPL